MKLGTRIRRVTARALVPLLLLALIAGPLGQTACSPRMAQFMAGAFIVGTAVAIMAHHDSHHHYRGCGHEYVVIEDRDVYQYQGQWEYYDDYDGRWYYYQEDPVPTRQRTVHHYYY